MTTKSTSRLLRAILLWGVCWLVSLSASAQPNTLERVEPVHWWVGMENRNLQLLLQGEEIAESNVSVDYEGINVEEVHVPDHPDYLFVDLHISGSTRPGTFTLHLERPSGETVTHEYLLKERRSDARSRPGIDQSDVLYLITPDRFANGDYENDEPDSLKEGIDRSFHSGRHGGDLQGIISKLDYLEELGVTALWLNPVLINDMPEYSYHGYATTDYYQIDPRYGSNELYKKLADELHRRDMKLVMDVIFNHSGLEHWWVDDPPFDDWIHEETITNHAIASVSDPYAAESDRQRLEEGWFVPTMPDLNHDNPFMANYLIQNSIWWVEYAGLDGIRMDTYPYNDPEMMEEWLARVYEEYPDFFIVGETWVENEAQEAWWAGKDPAEDHDFNTHLESITDFPLCMAIREAFGEEGNVRALYEVLSKDFLYERPSDNLVFPDNHDMDRLFYMLEEDLSKFKLAMAYLLTTRGIPQIYYGTEILMAGHGEHGDIREDFPGGWEDDKRNAFTEQGRTDAENEAFDYVSRLLDWRKDSDAIQSSELVHFVPEDNVYVYARQSGEQTLLVLLNNSDEQQEVDMSRFSEVTDGYATANEVLTGREMTIGDSMEVSSDTALILELKE